MARFWVVKLTWICWIGVTGVMGQTEPKDTKDSSACVDQLRQKHCEDTCTWWLSSGRDENYRASLQTYCPLSCGFCGGEDASEDSSKVKKVPKLSSSLSCPQSSKSGEAKADLEALSKDIQTLGVRLFHKHVIGGQLANENVFFSPTSISLALGMLQAGADGATLAEMTKVLYPSFDGQGREKLVSEATGALMAEILTKQTDAKFDLKTANAIYTQDRFPLLPDFLNTITGCFKGEAKTADFENNAEQERTEINKWVADQTNDRIQDLMPPGSIKANTIMALVNAIYFKGNWKTKFKPESTSKKPFFAMSEKLGNSQKLTVDMMHNLVKGDRRFLYPYWENDDMQVLALPYEKDELSMVIFLPKELNGLSENLMRKPVEELQATVSNALTNLEPTRIGVISMPKFKMEHRVPLLELLKSIGLKSMFSPTANFSKISALNGISVSEAQHKAFIEVNEEGTEAAAATGLTLTRTAVVVKEKFPDFKADHPFMYMIRHNPTNSILFMGQYVLPDSKE